MFFSNLAEVTLQIFTFQLRVALPSNGPKAINGWPVVFRNEIKTTLEKGTPAASAVALRGALWNQNKHTFEIIMCQRPVGVIYLYIIMKYSMRKMWRWWQQIRNYIASTGCGERRWDNTSPTRRLFLIGPKAHQSAIVCAHWQNLMTVFVCDALNAAFCLYTNLYIFSWIRPFSCAFCVSVGV